MLAELHIEGFRCFKTLHVAPLGRVNLVVGKNSAGKTALLDAVELLVTEHPTPYIDGLVRRQEVSIKLAEDSPGGTATVHHLAAVANLFYGYKFSAKSHFSVRTEPSSPVWTEIRIEEQPKTNAPGRQAIWSHRQGGAFGPYPLSSDGTLGYAPTLRIPEGKPPVLFLSTVPPDTQSLSSLWDQILLTDDEPLVIDALRIIEPRVERLAFRGEGPNRSVVIKLAGDKGNRLLGSLGDGMRRLLGLALHLVATRGGYLLVDDIDTGLHHSVMEKMWQLVIEAAKRLNVQIFATTHSADCIKALAGVHAQNPLKPTELMVHRVVFGRETTISFTPDDLGAVAEYQGEVR